MKKLLLFFAMLSFLVIPTTQSFATEAAIEITNPNLSILGFRPSNNVELLYGETDTTGAGPQAYVIMAKHDGGDRIYGSTTNSNLISTPADPDCKGATVSACIGFNGATALDAGTHGEYSNTDSLTTWEIE